MFSAEEEKFHSLGPKDLGLDPEKKASMSIDIARNTNHTGEQLHVSVPIYGNETREEIQRRLGFAYSVIQDRLEAENKVIDWQNSKQATMRRAVTMIEHLKKDMKRELLALDKRKRKEKWDDERTLSERRAVVDSYKEKGKEHQIAYAHAKAEVEAQKDLPMGEYQDEIEFDEGSDNN
jgi:hypothetical protein